MICVILKILSGIILVWWGNALLTRRGNRIIRLLKALFEPDCRLSGPKVHRVVFVDENAIQPWM